VIVQKQLLLQYTIIISILQCPVVRQCCWHDRGDGAYCYSYTVWLHNWIAHKHSQLIHCVAVCTVLCICRHVRGCSPQQTLTVQLTATVLLLQQQQLLPQMQHTLKQLQQSSAALTADIHSTACSEQHQLNGANSTSSPSVFCNPCHFEQHRVSNVPLITRIRVQTVVVRFYALQHVFKSALCCMYACKVVSSEQSTVYYVFFPCK
jgi:hypothetical protein